MKMSVKKTPLRLILGSLGEKLKKAMEKKDRNR